MHPIERLRHVARSQGLDADTLAYESADALGGLGFDPQAIVLAVRRLIDAHPECGPLWWVAAHLLASDDPYFAAQHIADQLATDATRDELACALPGAAHVVVSPTPAIVAACTQRPDLSVDVAVSYADGYETLRSLRVLAGSRAVEVDDLFNDHDHDHVTVVVSALAASSDGYLLSLFDAELIERARAGDADIWIVAGLGHILPASLFHACLRHLGLEAASMDDDRATTKRNTRTGDMGPDDSWRFVPLIAAADVVVGPLGPFVPRPDAFRSTCPVPGELRNA